MKLIDQGSKRLRNLCSRAKRESIFKQANVKHRPKFTQIESSIFKNPLEIPKGSHVSKNANFLPVFRTTNCTDLLKG